MSILDCPEGMRLIANVSEALHRQCDLPAQASSSEEIAREMDLAEAVRAASRHATDHLSKCPICRTD
jgi:hypothetical protein